MPNNRSSIPASIRDILCNPSPANLNRFDPWNSSSTGHQRAERSQDTSWREVRSVKLAGQFGNKEVRGADLEGKGAWKWTTPAEREEGKRKAEGNEDIRSFFSVKKRRIGESVGNERKLTLDSPRLVATRAAEDKSRRLAGVDRDAFFSSNNGIRSSELATQSTGEDEAQGSNNEHPSNPSVLFEELEPPSSQLREPPKDKGIFRNLTIYINGSTYPTISDHRLKQILADNGANMSIHLARRSVTHVILGRPASEGEKSGNSGAGGGLASGKLQREIQRIGGKGIKFVGVEWVLESVKAGRRLPEARFANLHMASRNQRSVLSDFAA